MVVDLESLGIMEFIAAKTGVVIKVTAKAGERYSSHGGEGTLVVPDGYVHISVNPGNTKINDYWDKVCVEKTKRRKIWEAANPIATR